MSTARGAKLKAQYNRVRTSTALRANNMWTQTIGVEQDPQAGSNAAIEAQIYAPTHGGGGGRAARQQAAQQLISAAGYQPAITDMKGLMALANAQGALGAGSRGACKLCGGMGHTTKQCTNFLTGHNARSDLDTALAGAGQGGLGMGLLPDPGNLSDLSDLSDSSSSSDGSGSDSDSSRDERKSRKKHKKKHKKHRSKSDSKKDKKEKKEKKSKKDKKERRERERSRSRSRSRERRRD